MVLTLSRFFDAAKLRSGRTDKIIVDVHLASMRLAALVQYALIRFNGHATTEQQKPITKIPTAKTSFTL